MKIKIKDRWIGRDEPCFIVVEAGVNFSSLEEAKNLIDKAMEIKADAIKFQTYHADTLVTKKATITIDGGKVVNQYECAKKEEFKLDTNLQKELFKYADEKGIICFSTPSHKRDVDFLEEMNVPVYKLGSDDLVNLPLLEYVAKKNKPIILSTGMATIEEIKEAVYTITKAGNDQIVILHCITSYPTLAKDANLKFIKTLLETFLYPIGFSDHTKSISIPIAAAVMGACFVEKHFTLNKNAEGADHFFSTEPKDMKLIIDSIREIESGYGSYEKILSNGEKEMRKKFRKSIFAVKDIPKGTIITEDMIDIKKPNIGLAPKLFDNVIGKKVKIDIKVDDSITEDKI